MAAAANNFLASLDAKQKDKATYDLKAEDRFKWHFIPTEMIEGGRTGLPMTEMNKDQKALAKKLLQSAMSKSGFRKSEFFVFSTF